MIEFPEQIRSDLESINEVAHELQMKLFVVGGFPRDLVFGVGISEETDLDVTEGFGNAFDLAFFVAARYKLMDPIVYDATGTALVVMPSGRHVEFHNAYYKVPHIIDQLYVMQIKPTSINKDIYCRDFTINSLLFDPDTGKIIDITGKGIHDIENRILRTPLKPSKILSISPKNILRGIRFKIQFGLTEDEEYSKEVINFIPNLIEFLKKNPNSKMVSSTVKKTLAYNAEQAVEEYRKFGILEYLPKEEEIEKILKKEILGVTVTAGIREAQEGMKQRVRDEYEKHKTYMRRKKREEQDWKVRRLKILERAKNQYYLNHPEKEYVKNDKRRDRMKLFNYITEEFSNAVE